MDIDPQKKTWNSFVKLTIYGTFTIIFILVLLAVILL